MGKKKAAKDFHTDLLPPMPMNAKQAELIKNIHNKELTITLGPAGTGKTYIPSCLAGFFYKKGMISKIVITRPNIPTGKSIGFFPGTLNEKMEPWVKPIISVLEDYLTRGAIETMVKSGNIEVVPFETIRGRSWDDTFIILDEAQNTSVEEMKAFVTRIGENCKVVINGDVTQSDLKDKNNGLSYIVNLCNNSDRLRQYVSIVGFNSADIVRSGLVKALIQTMEEKG